MKKDTEKRSNSKKLCSHSQFEKEYILGSDTGDIICTQCGKVFSRDSQFPKFKN
nr:hypothetical protein [uncultured Draconibacterium sp.]